MRAGLIPSRALQERRIVHERNERLNVLVEGEGNYYAYNKQKVNDSFNKFTLIKIFFITYLVPSKNLCGVPVDVLAGCTGKDVINGSENPQNSTGITKNAAAHPTPYNACIDGNS